MTQYTHNRPARTGRRPTKARSNKRAWEDRAALALRVAGIDVEREYRWEPERGGHSRRFDIAVPAARSCLEVEGGIWQRGGGGHSHPSGIESDIQRANDAAMLGWTMFRASTSRESTFDSQVGQFIAFVRRRLAELESAEDVPPHAL